MRILSFITFAAISLLSSLVVANKATDGQKLELEAYRATNKLNPVTTRRIGLDPDANEFMVIDRKADLPERFIEVIEAIRGIDQDGNIDPMKIDVKIKLNGKPLSGKTLGKIATMLDTVMTDSNGKLIRQFGTDAIADQFDENWSLFHFNGKMSAKYGKTFYGFGVGRISVQQSFNKKYAILANGKLNFISYQDFTDYAMKPSMKKLFTLIDKGIDIGFGFVLTRSSVNDIAALVTNGNITKVIDSKFEIEPYKTKYFIPMAAIDVDGIPKTGAMTAIRGDIDSREVDVGIDIRDFESPQPLLKHFDSSFEEARA